MRKFFVAFLRGMVRVFPEFGLKLANAIRIRPVVGSLLDVEVITRYFEVNLQVQCMEWHGFYIHVGRCYEREVLRLLKERFGRCKIFFDVGANVGIHSLVFAKANPEARVFSFEPVPELVERLEGNIRLNPEITNVKVMPLALSNRKETCVFEIDPDRRNQGGGSLLAAEGKQKIQVKTYSLLDVWNEFSVWPDLMKVDVEGAELLVLEGLGNALETGKAAPDLILEIHGWMFPEKEVLHSEGVIQFLQRWKYHAWLLDESNGHLTPVKTGMSIPSRAMLLASVDPVRF